jgi:undecaprenyl-diphosphatase
MFGASLLKLVKFGFDFSGTELFYLLAGMLIAFGVSVYAIRFLMSYIRNNNFKPFGYYRIVLGVVVLAYFGVRALIG